MVRDSFKCSSQSRPCGLFSRGELERMTRRFTSEILPLIGPETDIPAPDVYTDAQTMAWMMDTYSIMVGHSAFGVVTGKPLSLGGSEGRADAAARGLLFVTEEACKVKKISLRGASVAIQGYGNVGSGVARLFAEKKAASWPSAIRAAEFSIPAASIRSRRSATRSAPAPSWACPVPRASPTTTCSR